MENPLILLSEKDFGVGTDGEYMVPEAEPDADEDINMQTSNVSPAEGEWPAGETKRQLLLAWRAAISLPGPESPKVELTNASKKPRVSRRRWKNKHFDSPLSSPLTSPISLCFDEYFDKVGSSKPVPYLATLPSLPPPSKRICLSRLRLLAWDPPTKDHPQGQVFFRERLTQKQPRVNVGLRQPYRSPFEDPGIINASPGPQVAISRAARGKSGWSLSFGNYLRAMVSGSSFEDADGAYVEGNIIIYYARLWKALAVWLAGVHQAVLANPIEYVMVAVRMVLMCVMMWLANNLRAYDEWKLANNEPRTLDTILETMNWIITKIGLVDTARFGVQEWLKERTWTG
ncbi:haloacid dehalogenase [Penicillium atrosanguineum]|uniref:haloacid dehalogenase n=1 Tax=Penicillium atrosanguineum TaxID=1132637 RepID=UPI0023843DEE|nr:haloacid dehalogenase [Penicillium atrosanguineum]KAJ5304001.1 haloacid dehalogenase [Penicillium atrosanguineum]